MLGIPIVGDFDGDGTDDLAVFNNNVFFFDLPRPTASAATTRRLIWGFPGVLDRPVAADMDQDGIDDIGLWVPRNSASVPREVSEWYFLMSDAVMAPVTERPESGYRQCDDNVVLCQQPDRRRRRPIQGKLIRFLSGANAGQMRTVTAFNPANGQVTFSGSQWLRTI